MPSFTWVFGSAEKSPVEYLVIDHAEETASKIGHGAA